MRHKCGECGAKLKSGQNECAYCGTIVTDADEQLLTELTAVARKYNEAWARGNRLEIDKCLADEFEGRLSDGGEEDVFGKKTLLENARVH